jgi:hypothetical protein
MFSLRIFLVVLFLNSYYLSISQQHSAYQPTMPCSRMNPSLKWNSVEEDLKDFLIIQSLIGEERFEDLQEFFEKQGYSQQAENSYLKSDRMNVYDEVVPIIRIINTEQSYIDNGYAPISSRIFLRADKPELYLSQFEHNRIWLFLMETFEKGLPYKMFKSTIEFHEEEGSEINYIDKYNVEVTSSENQVETFSTSNSTFVPVGERSEQKYSVGAFFGPSQTLFIQIIASQQKDGNECGDDIYFSSLQLSSTSINQDKNIDVELFKGLSGLNKIIWDDYQ